MGGIPFSLTTKQKLNKKIKELEVKLHNEKNARRNDREEFEYQCNQCKGNSGKKESVINMFQQTIANLTETIEKQGEIICEQKKRIEELEDQNAVLKGRVKKDSSNSSKPPSTDGFKKPKTYSTREKSEKKPGGQAGHAGHTLKIDKIEKKVVDRKEGTCTCGGEIAFGEQYQSRSVVDILVTLEVTEEHAYKGECKSCKKPFQAAFSSGFRAPIQYGSNMNALVAILNEYGNVADQKTADIVSSICGNSINMSAGTVVNIRTALSNKLNDTVKAIKEELIKSDVLNVDETGVHVNGKLNWVNIFSNDQYTLFQHNQKRSAHCDDKDGILAFFIGILVHDHFKAYYKNNVVTHSECNQHILRYLKAVIEIQGHDWARKMTDFLLNSKKLKEEYVTSSKDSFSQEQFVALEQEYLSILDDGDREYQVAIDGKKNISRFTDERRLLARLREYKDEHLRFLSNFNAPFGNNAAEQDAHFMKNKTRVSGGFRSEEGADNHMIIASVISSAKKQKLNPYTVIKNTFDGLHPFDST